MIAALGWYVVLAALGAIVWPLAFRLLPGLPDRGYTLSRALGLLLTGYVYWLLGVLGLLNNTIGGALFAAAIVLAAAAFVYWRAGDNAPIAGWLRDNYRLVITAEVLFLVAFAGWALFRAHTPDITGTEKPMELAFLNGVRRSPSFPPRDPWLAGYGISYYYFGYVLVAMVADLAGVTSGVAFNLGIATLFALTLLGSYGLIYNLVVAHRREHRQAAVPEAGDSDRRVTLTALTGPLFLAVMGNLAGALELLHALNLPALGARFWAWLDITDLSAAPAQRLWPPAQWRYWWWWRASRVIHDRSPLGESIGLQPIDEFPFFSFLLGDMHPHVLALPFVLLTLALALNLLLQPAFQGRGLRRAQAALYVVAFGGLAFLNTWDLPIYLFVLIAALIVRQIRRHGQLTGFDVARPLLIGAGLGMAGLLAYLPWLLSFDSQAGGILPNALYPTRLHQFGVMFGPLLLIVAWFAVQQAIRAGKRADWPTAGVLTGGLLITLIAFCAALSIAALRTSPEANAALAAAAGSGGVGAALRYRLAHPLTPIVLTLLLAAVVAALLPRPDAPEAAPGDPSALSASSGFALVLIATGALLTLGPEFVYLRDNFGERLNTVFKFYYAAWVLWAVGAAYAVHVLAEQKGVVNRALGALAALAVVAGLVYPAIAIPTRAGAAGAEASTEPATLDGTAFLYDLYPADYDAIVWLAANAPADSRVLEAVGGAYSDYGRVSAVSGVPTIMGWANHERQWRGDRYDELAGTREQDVREIYATASPARALELLQRYDVDYVFVGTLEQRTDYASAEGLAKFERFLTPVYQAGGVTIYDARQPRIEGIQ